MVGLALRWVAEPEALPVDSFVIVGPLTPLDEWMVAAEQAVVDATAEPGALQSRHFADWAVGP